MPRSRSPIVGGDISPRTSMELNDNPSQRQISNPSRRHPVRTSPTYKVKPQPARPHARGCINTLKKSKSSKILTPKSYRTCNSSVTKLHAKKGDSNPASLDRKILRQCPEKQVALDVERLCWPTPNIIPTSSTMTSSKCCDTSRTESEEEYNNFGPRRTPPFPSEGYREPQCQENPHRISSRDSELHDLKNLLSSHYERKVFPFRPTPSGNFKVSQDQIVFQTPQVSILAADPARTMVNLDENGGNKKCLFIRDQQGFSPPPVTKEARNSNNTDKNRYRSFKEGHDSDDEEDRNPRLNFHKWGSKPIPVDTNEVKLPAKSSLADLLMHRITAYSKPDCTVRIGAVAFNCHAMVLQCYSKYFDNIDLVVNKEPITLPEGFVSDKAFACIYNWMINSDPLQTVLTTENILEIVSAAHYLRVTELIQQCSAFLNSEELFYEDTAFSMFLKAIEVNNTEVMENMLERIMKFFLVIVSSREFVQLDVHEVTMLLHSNYICVHSEIEVFMAAVRWLTHAWQKREECVEDVMRCVRFGLMTPWQLVEIRRNPENPQFIAATQNPEVQTMIDDGLAYAIIKWCNNGCQGDDHSTHPIDTFGLSEITQRNWVDEPINYTTYDQFLQDLKIYHRHYISEQKLARKGQAKTGKYYKMPLLPPKADATQSVLPNSNDLAQLLAKRNITDPPLADARNQQIEVRHAEEVSKERSMFLLKLSSSMDSVTTYSTYQHRQDGSDVVTRDQVGTKHVEERSGDLTHQNDAEKIKDDPLKLDRRNSSFQETEIKSTCYGPSMSSSQFPKGECNTGDSFPSSSTEEYDSRGMDSSPRPKTQDSRHLGDVNDNEFKGGNMTLNSSHQDNPKQKSLQMKTMDLIYENTAVGKDAGYSTATQPWFMMERKESKVQQFQKIFNDFNTPRRNYFGRDSLYLPDHDGVLVIGGLDPHQMLGTQRNTGTEIIRYHPCKREWEKVAHLPQPRIHHSVASFRGKVYVAGGQDPRDDNSVNKLRPVNTLWSFDPVDKSWGIETSMRCPRKHFGLVAAQGKLYVIGGVNGEGRTTRSMERYDPKTKVWEEMSPMHFARMGFATAFYNGDIWVAGGMKEERLNSLCAEVERYDPRLDQWSFTTKLRSPRCFPVFIVKSNSLYIIGGAGRTSIMCKATSSVNDIDLWDNKNKQWVQKSQLSIPRHGHSVSYLGSQILIIGGMTTVYKRGIETVECYCCERNSWVIRQIKDLPTCLSGHGSITLPPAKLL